MLKGSACHGCLLPESLDKFAQSWHAKEMWLLKLQCPRLGGPCPSTAGLMCTRTGTLPLVCTDTFHAESLDAVLQLGLQSTWIGVFILNEPAFAYHRTAFWP